MHFQKRSCFESCCRAVHLLLQSLLAMESGTEFIDCSEFQRAISELSFSKERISILDITKDVPSIKLQDKLTEWPGGLKRTTMLM